MAAGKKSGRHSQQSNDFLFPYQPTIGTATDVGTNRPFNNGAATVTFTPNATGPAATSYTVTSSPGGYTSTASSSPISVQGLQSNTAYTFTVVATNSYGNSIPSAASNSITATTVPDTPIAPSVTSPANSGSSTDTLTFTAPSNGGKVISTYYWDSSDGKSGNTTSTSVSVGQEGGSAQTYRVYVKNANGSSQWSPSSASVTTFSFVPFGFTPFGFTPFGFTPFGFTPFGFTPFGFGVFAGCIEENTMISTPSGKVPAKDLVIGDTIYTVDLPELQSMDADSDYKSFESNSLTSSKGLVETVLTGITLQRKIAMYFNGESESMVSLEQPMFVKRNDIYEIIPSGVLEEGDFLIKVSTNGELIETLIESITVTDQESNTYNFECEPSGWFIAGDMLVHIK